MALSSTHHTPDCPMADACLPLFHLPNATLLGHYLVSLEMLPMRVIALGERSGERFISSSRTKPAWHHDMEGMVRRTKNPRIELINRSVDGSF